MATRTPEGAAAAIAEVIRRLPPELPLTSADVANIVEIICEREVTRQWIWEAKAIGEAVRGREEDRLAAGGAAAGRPLSTSLQKAQAVIKRLREEIKSRDICLDQYHELLMRHLYNARLHHISQADLEKPLSKLNR